MTYLSHNTDHIWTIDNSAEEKFLRTPVAEFDLATVSQKDLNELSAHMRFMMISHRGVGLSANQIGLAIRLFVCQLPLKNGKGYKGKFYTIINPKIISHSSDTCVDQEGCLSIPSLYGDRERFEKIVVEGFDKNKRPLTVKAEGFLARIMQHEIDHLNGILFIDKARNIQKIFNE